MTSLLQTALGFVAVVATACWVALGISTRAMDQRAILFAASIAIGNGLCALLASYIGARRATTKGFFAAVLGGMALRMVGTLLAFVVGLRVLLLPPAVFGAALLTFTGLFIAAEISLWSRQDFSPRVQHS